MAVILITGASSGIGEACARSFASAGNSLILAARRQPRLQQIAAELSAQVPVHILPLDVADRDAVARSIEDLPESFRDVDTLINNAGLALGTDPAQQSNLDDWDTMIDTNIKGLTYLTRACLPGMVARDRGHVVNLGSTAGSWPYPGGNTYCGTKAFVAQFSRCLRADLVGTAVRVSCVSPGMVETEFSEVRMKGDREKAAKVYERTRPLAAQDIANIVLWICNAPAHVNINEVEVMPVCQAWGGWAVARDQLD